VLEAIVTARATTNFTIETREEDAAAGGSADSSDESFYFVAYGDQ